MCGRYANHVGAMHGWTDILDDWPQQIPLGFNVSPTQVIPAFSKDGGQGMRWGLIPNWLDKISSEYNTFNARLKTAHEKPTFRHAWGSHQRCLIPALGYYEWRSENGGKQPYFICRKDGAPVVFGGLFEPQREELPASCTILTRPAEGSLQDLHHSMPVLLEPQHTDVWFNGDDSEVNAIAWRTYQDDYHFYPVSKLVNSSRNQGPELIQPQEITEQQQGFGF